MDKDEKKRGAGDGSMTVTETSQTTVVPSEGAGAAGGGESRRDAFRRGFAERHPDVDMDDEDAYYGALADEYDQQQGELTRYRDDNDKLNRLFAEHPNAAYFMNDLIDGKTPMGVALMREFGETFRDAVEDPTEENVKAFSDALAEHAERIKEDERLQAEFEQNAAATEQTIADWAKTHNADQQQMDAVRDFINAEFANLITGRITPELLDFAWKGLHYDQDVAAAEETGAAQGRNEKIAETMKRGSGDGVPVIGGGRRAADGDGRDEFLREATMREDPWAKAKRTNY